MVLHSLELAVIDLIYIFCTEEELALILSQKYMLDLLMIQDY